MRSSSAPLAVAFLVCSLLAFPSESRGEKVTFTAKVDKKVAYLGERITLEVTVGMYRKWFSGLRLPRHRYFRVKKRSQQKLQEAVYIGGQPKIRYIRRYVLKLKPRRAGHFKLSAGKLRVGRKRYRTAPIAIEIRKGTPIPRLAGDKLPGYIRAAGDIFLLPVLQPKQIYVGQQTTISYYLFRRIDARIDSPRMPRLPDFWTQPLVPIHPLGNWNFRTLQGKRYSYTLALRNALFPLRPGKLAVPGLGFRVKQSYASTSTAAKVVRSPTVYATALALPQKGKPPGLEGPHVGRFKIQARLLQSRFRTREPINLQITVTGSGNIRQLSLPTLPKIANLREISSRTKHEIKKVDGQIQGSKHSIHTFQVSKVGGYQIPALSFSYFDPWQRTYHSLRTPPLRFQALAGYPQLQKTLKGRIAMLAKKPKARGTKLKLSSPSLRKLWPQNRSMLWLAAPLPFLVLFLLFAFRKKRKVVQEERQERAEKEADAQQQYSQARQQLQHWLQTHSAQVQPAALGSLELHLHAMLQALLDTPTRGLSRDQLTELLQGRSETSGSIPQLVQELLHTCDQVRFSPMAGHHPEIPQYLQQLLQQLPG